ncbi:hypothetical protein DES53_103337 [Roseimicrobium gellanilyticum]|uniref:Uncharacterized protein n=1 Tax=Roseimicrobium gellanilyticum TaxID=748857 RepID=A0A366HR66_9BACT|nr:Amuc_1099 family pilus-like system protein [Roseimicrobium gellanilyticum]RBP45339.1 hypothetical protein DES53_103337 [Roseimicrobium gellanilyticum]
MQKKQSNYERVILGLMAVLALAASGWFIYQALGFANTLEPKPFTKKNERDLPPIEKVDLAIKNIVTPPAPWVAPERANKRVPLNKSVLLVLKDEQLFDLALPEPKLRDPMTNEYLVKYELQYLLPNVASLDPDSDGFTNLEEFTAQPQTNPKDPKSMPPVTDKLFLVERISNDYKITLRSSSAPFQVATPNEAKRRNWFVDPDAKDSLGNPDAKARSFGGSTGERFLATKFEKKSVPDPRLGELDVSELTIKELVTDKPFVLIMKQELNLAVYEAKMEFRLRAPAVPLPPVKEGDQFRIPGFEATTYKVLKINEDSVNIAPVGADGTVDESKPILIKRA